MNRFIAIRVLREPAVKGQPFANRSSDTRSAHAIHQSLISRVFQKNKPVYTALHNMKKEFSHALPQM